MLLETEKSDKKEEYARYGSPQSASSVVRDKRGVSRIIGV